MVQKRYGLIAALSIMAGTILLSGCAANAVDDAPDSFKDEITQIVEAPLSAGFVQSTENGVIEEAVFEDAVEGSGGGFAIPARANRTYNGFLDIFFCWEQEEIEQSVKLFCNGTASYVFLPSYAPADGLRIEYDEDAFALSLDGTPLRNSQTLAGLRVGWDYDLDVCYKNGGEPSAEEYGYYSLRLMQSENLPAIFVDTFNGTLEYLDWSKSNYEPGNFVCINADGTLDARAEISKIHLRGSTSVGAAQKSYTFIAKSNVDILGLGAADKWCLIGSGFDPTRMRNALAYTLAKDMELPYAVDFKFVDVYFNGEYHGLTLLTEPVEVAENRIEPDGVEYLLKVDRFGDKEPVYFMTGDTPVQVVYPEKPKKDEVETLRDEVDSIYRKISQCDTPESFDNLCNSMDMDSFAKKYIISALANEADANGISTYYYWNDGKLYAGPVWDFDRAYGNEIFGYYRRGFNYRLNSYDNGPAEELMLVNDGFRNYIRDVALDHRHTFFALKDNLTRYMSYCRDSLEMTYVRFPETMAGFADFGDLDSNINYLQNMLDCRTDLIWDTIVYPERYHRIILSSKQLDRLIWIEDNEILSEDLVNSILIVNGCQNVTYINGGSIRYDIPVTSDLRLIGS